ncbi:GNAT family N-acetyltransferase [Pseudofrancisella aestuarii]|uniref:GNAT family N-acetyltransferase n=1 Tax=Pseudofrancisella aestuarii TaxID=2670347 RepID=A0ABV9TBP4_9GAMM|nr:GNAT family protein [Pseudofrancisella aestuarii]
MISLEKFTENDIKDLLNWLDGTDIRFLYQFGGINYKFPLDEAQIKQTMQNDKVLLFRVTNSLGRSIGHCQIIRLDLDNRTASIGRLLISDKERNKGLGSVMIKKLLSYAKQELGLQEISLKVFDFNISAIRCYERLGFIAYDKETLDIPNLNERWELILMKREL